MKTIKFSICKKANLSTKDRLVSQGCVLVGNGNYAYNLTTTDISLIPNAAKIRVTRKDYPTGRFSDCPESTRPTIVEEPGVNGAIEWKMYHPILGEFGFISGKQFKALHEQ